MRMTSQAIKTYECCS